MSLNLRIVRPEILDGLPADDPDARRSRIDLRRVNFLMGNERWIARQIPRFSRLAENGGIVEIGAGEGRLSSRIQSAHPATPVSAYDLATRPAAVHEGVRWHREDVLAARPQSDGILMANLFLHHFEGAGMEALGRLCSQFRVLCFAEPLRSRFALAQGTLLHPFVNRVTRHDMPVSIRAGFRRGELPALLGLDSGKWNIREETTWRGGIRVLAWRA